MKRSRGVADVVESLISSLKEAGSKKKRDADRKYLKMDERQDRHAIQNYGVTVPQTVQILKNWMKENKGSFVATEVATQLWDWKDDHDKPVFEHRLAAIKLLRFSNSTLSALDFPLLDKCVNESGTWALIDEICTHVAPFVIYKLEYPEDQLFKWSVHENFWVRRSCLLTHLLALRQGDTSRFESFCKYAIPMIPEKVVFFGKINCC